MRRDRCTPCGGVMILARHGILMRRRRDLETDAGEDLWVVFTLRNRSVYVCVVYIKPSASDSDYFDWFCKVESFINNLNGFIIILGDLNLNSASQNVKNYFCYFVSYCNLFEKNHIVNTHGSMLDVILVRVLAKNVTVSVNSSEGMVNPDAYHPPLDISFSFETQRPRDRMEPSNIGRARDWNFKKCNHEALSQLLCETSWSNVIDSTNVDTAVHYFYQTVYNLFDSCIPKKVRSRVVRRYPVWFTKDIIRDCERKLKLHRIWKKSQLNSDYKRFTDMRSSLNDRINIAYKIYIKDVEHNIRKHPQKFWAHVSGLRSKGGFEPAVDSNGERLVGTKAAEAFANFFSSVFLPEVPALNASEANSSDNNRNSNMICVQNFSPQQVKRGITKLKPNSSVGPDEIPPSILKKSNYFVLPLFHIFNLSLKSGTYPSQWKLSRVTPIPKTGNTVAVEDFRPIAILSTPAKVFESILHEIIYKQVNVFLSDEQHGFRSKRSVNSNLLTLVDYISECLDRGGQVDVLYFDFRKAFDRVNNDILLSKLSKIGFAPNLLQLMANYLQDRKQFVRLGLYESKSYHTRSGVSQGSILGPLLFLIMINDLPSVLERAKCLLYADDLKLFMEIKSEAECVELQNDIDAVIKWSDENRMEFNTNKCSVMTFGRKRCPVYFPYNMNGVQLPRQANIKDLGIIFDHKLTFHDHISTLASESFKRLGFVLRNTRDFQNCHTIKLVFDALVRAKLETSACIWNPYESTYILLLEKVQKAFLRYLYKRLYGYYPFMYPTKFLQGHLGFNSLKTRRECDQIGTICKILRGVIDCSELHNKLCSVYAPTDYSYLRRRRKFFVSPFSRTVARARSPIPRTLAALNALLKESPRCDIFADKWADLIGQILHFCENF
ncbi:uncharacterized protein LOC123872917 isoform X2 [Maniola jurtina]|uniref:uncharacterized protein LOC123872917 isoform X1 n=1 Tax=Maniola jurtina TaxID=191418 RepID=UPI001E68EC04|nr:uncharacterized protein LOC123872917 isoform X1 [Maniola jurtina]XP_045773471.1 uncharacterized protein LOC123872917 isoform X2 [Maniola jurtina]